MAINRPIVDLNSMEALIDELKNATGMKLDHYQRNFLEKRINFRMEHLGIENYIDYINLIHSSPVERDLFLDKFTINYTYFFRNLTVFQNFEKFIQFYVRKLEKSKKIIRIWSAPCATGDEPYSLAMILDNIKKKKKIFPDFKIYASDIDTNAIKLAVDGEYGEYAVHELPEHYLTTYFTKTITELGPKYKINDQIKNKVEFIQEDILKGSHVSQKYDVIFCRNFFIYINQNARDLFLKIIENRLYNGGLLCIGGSETLARKYHHFTSVNLKDRFYIKGYFDKNESYRNGIAKLLGAKRITKKHSPSRKIKKLLKTEKTREKPKRETKLIDDIKEIFERKEIKEEVHDIQGKERTEVKFTKIVVNNGTLDDNIKHTTEPLIVPTEEGKTLSLEHRGKSLKRRELLLQQKELHLDEKIKYIVTQSKFLEGEREKIDELSEILNKKEEEIINRTLVLERITRQMELRKRNVAQRETQLEKRLNLIGQYSRQMVEQERRFSNDSRKFEENNSNEDEINSFEEKRIDRIKTPNEKNELNIPKGYYSLINSFDKNERSTKLTINGLGSGIALVFKDAINNIFAMSHITLPSSRASKQGYHLLFPHTFVDTSVQDLYNNVIYNGGNRSSIKAFIVGGAKLFLDYDMTYQENIDAIREELVVLQIEIEGEDIGGLSERSIKYDTINDVLYVKKTWEFEYRKIK